MQRQKWDKWKGDKDLYEKYDTIHVKGVGTLPIMAIRRTSDGIDVNCDNNGSVYNLFGLTEEELQILTKK